MRAVSRAVAVLRTGLVDSGLGMDVLRIVLGRELGDRFGGNVSNVANGNGGTGLDNKVGRADKWKGSGAAEDEFTMDTSHCGTSRGERNLGEDASAALSAVCNIVNDFSPLRPVSILGLLEIARLIDCW